MGSMDRFQRQAELVPRSALEHLGATVIGVGAIGRQVAAQLASLGIRRLTLVDFDRVEPTNVTTQGYLIEDLGLPKVEATGRALLRIEGELHLEQVDDRFRPQHAVEDAVFCCVDSITSRAAIWRNCQRRCRFWCDGRMLGETMRILAATEEQGQEHYPTTLFQQSEAQAGSCTSRGVIYTACIAAGLMVHQFTRWLRKLPIDPDVSLNLLAGELIAR